MSGSFVPEIPDASALSKFTVGKPVYGTHGLRWAEALAFLLGRAVPPIASSGSVPKWIDAGSDQVIKIPYAPSKGAQVLFIEVEPRNQDFSTENVGATIEVTVDLTSGALNGGAWIGATQLDGSTQNMIAGRLQQQPVLCGWVDLTAVSKGLAASPFIKITVSINSSACLGLRRIHVTEIPLASYDPVSSVSEEISVDAGACASGTPIVAGGGSSPKGFYRVLSQLEYARYGVRRHMSLFTAEVDGGISAEQNCLHVTSTSYVAINEATSAVTGQTTTLYCRARRLYTTASANKYKLVVRYKNIAPVSGVGPSIKLTITPAGGSPATVTASLPDTSSGSGTGVWTDYLHSTNVDIPTDGTDQIVSVKIEGKVNSGTETATYAAIGLIENED